MADISIIHNGSTDYNVKDAVGREALAVVENKGAKNIAEVTAVSSTAGGVEYTVNPDGTVIANRTSSSTSSTWFRLNESLSLKAGTYVLSGGKNSGERVLLSPTTSLSDAIADSQGSGAEFTLTEDTDNLIYAIRVAYTDSPSNVKFYPMICTKAEWDISQAYVPYGKTNAELTSDVSALSAENTRQETEIGVVANAGAKNLIPINNLTTMEDSYCSWTVNADSSITVTPKSAPLSADWTKFVVNNFVLPAGTYIMSGGIAETSTSNKCDTYIANIDVNPAVTIARGWTNGYQTFTLMQPTHIRFAIRIKTSYNSTTPVIFKPMIRPAAITDATFQPYAKTNRELTVLTDEDRAALVEVVDSGAKNVLQFDGLTKTLHNGVAFTLNPDGTIKMERVEANSSASTSILTMSGNTLEIDNLCNGYYYLSGCPSGGGDTTFEIAATTASGSANPYIKRDYGSGVLLDDKVSASNIRVQLIARSAFTGSVTFKPMICSKADWNISHKYVPYKQDITWGFGDKIPQNSDFNSYTKFGVYRVESSTDAATMIHIPATGGGGRLEVKAANALNRIIQTYYISTTTFTRYYNGTTWSDWVQILSTATLDEIPTANSTNAVMSGGVWTDQQRQETEIGVVANAGAKNYCPKETETSTGSGFTADVEVNIPAGTYILSFTGTLAYTASFNIYRALPHSGNSLASINLLATTGAQSIKFTISETAKYIAFYHNGSGNSLTNIMLRPASITDPTFQPYAKTNRELTVLTDEDRAALVEIVDGGAKNFLTVNDAQDVNKWIDIEDVNIPQGKYIIYFGNITSDNVSDNVRLGFFDNNGIELTNTTPRVKKGNNHYVEIELSGVCSRCRIYGGSTSSESAGTTLSFSGAMICSKAAWDISHAYQPYCPSLPDLVAQKAANVVNGTSTLSGTGVSIVLNGGNIYRLTASAKYKAVNLSEIAIKYMISGTTYSVCSNSMTPTNNVVYLTTTGLITPSSKITVEAYVKTETNGNVEILLLAEKIYAN